MISKELLKEILEYSENIKIAKLSEMYLSGDEIYFTINVLNITTKKYETIKKYITVYKLCFKAKEWAEEQGYILSSSYGLCDVAISRNVQWIWNESADTEVEAIFKACEWVYNEI